MILSEPCVHPSITALVSYDSMSSSEYRLLHCPASTSTRARSAPVATTSRASTQKKRRSGSSAHTRVDSSESNCAGSRGRPCQTPQSPRAGDARAFPACLLVFWAEAWLYRTVWMAGTRGVVRSRRATLARCSSALVVPQCAAALWGKLMGFALGMPGRGTLDSALRPAQPHLATRASVSCRPTWQTRTRRSCHAPRGRGLPKYSAAPSRLGPASLPSVSHSTTTTLRRGLDRAQADVNAASRATTAGG